MIMIMANVTPDDKFKTTTWTRLSTSCENRLYCYYYHAVWL